MRLVLAGLLLLGACAGPTQAQLASTPTATTKATPANAPPASTSDEDRAEVTESFDDQRDAQNAHKEAAQESKAPPPPLPASQP